MGILIVVLVVAVVALCLAARHYYRGQKRRDFLMIRDMLQEKLVLLRQTAILHPAVSPETANQILMLHNAFRVFNQLTPESKGVNWEKETRDLHCAGDSIEALGDEVASQIHFALEADARGPSLIAELPLMLDAADNYLANSPPHSHTPLMMISIKNARQLYEDVRLDAATAPERNWLDLYSRMLAVELVCALVMQDTVVTLSTAEQS